MAKIILIETSTALCSVALAIDGEVVAYKQSSEPRAHASLTAVFIKEMLDEKGLKVSDCDAVCVSAGPGSYTGLRVGVSTAKGLCFAAGIPLLSVGTLDVLAAQGVAEIASSCHATLAVPRNDKGVVRIVPMIDARRMEVYTARYSANGERLGEVEARVIEAGDYAEDLAKGSVLFIGDGALKCKDVLSGGDFCQTYPKACAMAKLAEREYKAQNFKDIAYFEPFYLKQFTATVSKKKLF